MVNLDIMDKIEAFKGLDDDQLNHVQEHCKQIEFKQGERLFIDGDEATALWVMIEGTIDMRFDLPGRPTSKQNTIATITPLSGFWLDLFCFSKYKNAFCLLFNRYL